MADVETAVYQRLAADVPLNAVIGGRIYPRPAPQDAAFPLVTYEEVSAVDMNSHDTVLPTTQHRVNITVWSAAEATADGTRAVAKLIRDSMLGFQQSLRLNSLHRWDSEQRKFGIRQDFQVINRE
jgi:hypothetical protein